MMCTVVFRFPLGSSFPEINWLFRNRLKHVREKKHWGISEVATNNKTKKKQKTKKAPRFDSTFQKVPWDNL